MELKGFNVKRVQKGGIGLAVAVVLAWLVGLTGVTVPPVVVAAIASIVGSIATGFNEE